MVLKRTLWVFEGRELTEEESKQLTDYIIGTGCYTEFKNKMYQGDGPTFDGGRILAIKSFDQQDRRFVVYKHLYRSEVHQSTSFFSSFQPEQPVNGTIQVVIACDEPQQYNFIRGSYQGPIE